MHIAVDENHDDYSKLKNQSASDQGRSERRARACRGQKNGLLREENSVKGSPGFLRAGYTGI